MIRLVRNCFCWNKYIWRIFYRRWRFDIEERLTGYTVLLLMPAELPVFLRIALDTLPISGPVVRSNLMLWLDFLAVGYLALVYAQREPTIRIRTGPGLKHYRSTILPVVR